jgi:hypothetical protein
MAQRCQPVKSLASAARRARRRHGRCTIEVLLRIDTYDELVAPALAAAVGAGLTDCDDGWCEFVAEHIGADLEDAMFCSYACERLPTLSADLTLAEVSVSKFLAGNLREEAIRSARRTNITDPRTLAESQRRHSGYRLEASYRSRERWKRTDYRLIRDRDAIKPAS